MSNISDFKVICDERTNPPSVLEKDNFLVSVLAPKGYMNITFDENANIVEINGQSVKDIIVIEG